jgi:hypothetical protein
MPISQLASGTRTTVTPPEASYTSLGTDPNTTAGCYQLMVDVSAMANGDVLFIQCMEKCTGSGDTQRQVFEAVLANVQSQAMFATPALMLLNGWSFGLKQTAGSARALPWSIRTT